MNKKILSITILLILALITVLPTNVFATTGALNEIVEKFNNSSNVKNYGEILGKEFHAIVDENEPNVLSITITTGEEMSIVSYELQGSILSYEHLVDDSLITAYLLADSIGQVNGYEDGELLKNFNMFADEISNYTVENEGFELKENQSYYSAKMDITKKVPLIDQSEFYLKPDDFDILKEIIEEGENGNQSGRISGFAYNLIVGEDYNYIYIGEGDEITQSTYKSILSALEVMYGEKVVEFFKEVYPDFSEGSIFSEGITVELEVEMDLEEHPMFTGTKVTLVTIDNEYVKNELLRTEYIGETVNRGDKTITLDFVKDKSYKLGFFDSVTSSDAAFLYKYILEPVAEEAQVEIDGDTVYFNVDNGKIVLGDKDNSLFKVVIRAEYLEILPSKTDVEKTTLTVKHEGVKAKEYKEDATSADQFRYGEYKVTVNIIYGNEIEEEKATTTDNEKIEDTTINNPQTGDNIMVYATLLVMSLVGIVAIGNRVIKLLK